MQWISVFDPTVGTRPFETALCGDHQVGRIGVQSLRNNLLTHTRTVGVGGIDEIDPQFDGSPQNPDSFSPIRGLTPNTLSREPHRPKPQARHKEIIPDQEFADFPAKTQSWIS